MFKNNNVKNESYIYIYIYIYIILFFLCMGSHIFTVIVSSLDPLTNDGSKGLMCRCYTHKEFRRKLAMIFCGVKVVLWVTGGLE